MKKSIILWSSLASMVAQAQYSCGFSGMHTEHSHQIETNERVAVQTSIKNFKSLANTSSSGAYQGEIYEIPVVVHFLQTDNPSDLKITDEQIQTWIDNTNKIFATTYGFDYYPAGTGIEKGTIIPFRLVLAKRTIDNQPTNGIVRYDLSSNATYKQYGMQNPDGSASNGISFADIRAAAPHWDVNYYYNIYVVNAVNGGRDGNGFLGHAFPPYALDWQYDSFLRAWTVTHQHDYLLAHEIGHSLGLSHPFDGTKDANGCSTGTNDGVDDTEVIRNVVALYPVPNNTITNPCTNQSYQSGQYNIMNYTNSPRKFTPGQRDKIMTDFFAHRSVLPKSLGGREPNYNNTITPTTACSTARPTNAYQIGITYVKLGNIESKSSAGQGYTDYTLPVHTNKTTRYQTDLTAGQNIDITLGQYSAINANQTMRVWIDYNDNGKFEDNELATSATFTPKTPTAVKSITVPTNAVQGKYLRMRVTGDWNNGVKACEKTGYGEAEDYAVRIVSQGWVDTSSEIYHNVSGRVGVNTEQPKATLDVRQVSLSPQETSQGVIFPTFTTTDRSTFQNVSEGTMIFNTDKKCLEIYSNGAWKCL